MIKNREVIKTRLRNFLKGALCSLVLGSCADFKHVSLEHTLEPVSLEPKKLKTWQYPVNILGGYMIRIFIHEGGHALAALAQDVGVEEFRPYPGHYNGELHGGWVTFEGKSYYALSLEQRALINISGPLSDVLLSEIINYNLRHGKVSPEAQPFWATASLAGRLGPILIAINSFSDREINDFQNFEKHSGISHKTMAGLVGLYTALSAKRIAKEFRVALGKDIYDYKSKMGELNLVPTNDGIALTYSINF